MNITMLIGNLTKEPEQREAQNGIAICKFTIAVNDGYGEKKSTSYIPVTVFGKQAISCGRYLFKGSKCAVKGRIKTGSYEGKNGKVFTTEVIAEQVEFLKTEQVTEIAPAEETPPAGYSALEPDDMPF